MESGGAERSARARMREAARERREERARPRADILGLVVSGYACEAIAEGLKLGVETVRRETAKAMRVVDVNLEKGDLKAAQPTVKAVAQLDEYHALSLAPPLARAPQPLAPSAPGVAATATENGAQAVEIA